MGRKYNNFYYFDVLEKHVISNDQNLSHNYNMI